MQPDLSPVTQDVAAELSPPRYPFWTWVDFAIVLGLLVALILIIFFSAGAAVVIFPSLKTNQAPLLLPVQAAFYAAVYLAFFFVFHFRYREPVFASLGWKRTVPPRMLIYVGLLGALLSPIISWIASLLHTPEVQMDVLEQLQQYPVILALFGIMAVTVAPLFEELLFRGFLQPLLSRTFGVVFGILITGTLFGALHSFQYKGVWQYVAAISLVGVVLGIVRYRSGSIIPSTVMHACFNTIAAAGMFFQHK